MSITVEVRGGNLEKAMRVLKKKVQKAGLVKEARARQYFSKPSEIKREKAKERSKIIKLISFSYTPGQLATGSNSERNRIEKKL